jgi:drug/metabolite transporter (DMT)-like permease
MISAILISLVAVIVKIGNNKYLFSAGEMIVTRGLIQSIIVIIDIIRKKENIIPKDNKYNLLIWINLRGIFGGLAGALYFYAFTIIPIGDAITAFSLYPIIAAFLAYPMLKESISFIHIIALSLSIAGVILLTHPVIIFGNDHNNHHSPNEDLGYYASLGSAIFAGASFITMRKAKNASQNAILLSYGVWCIIIGIIAAYIEPGTHLTLNFNEWESIILLIGLGLLAYCANSTMTYSAKRIEAGIASFIRSSDSVYSYIWEVLFFHTIPSLLTIVGACLILSSILLVSLLKFYQSRKLIKEKKIQTEKEAQEIILYREHASSVV